MYLLLTLILLLDLCYLFCILVVVFIYLLTHLYKKYIYIQICQFDINYSNYKSIYCKKILKNIKLIKNIIFYAFLCFCQLLKFDFFIVKSSTMLKSDLTHRGSTFF